MKKIFFSAVILLLSCQLFAQQAPVRTQPKAAALLPPPLAVREVSGIVKDESGQTVIGANILLTSKSDTLRTATNTDGIFVLHNVKQGTFVVTAQSVGYLPHTERYRMNDLAKRVVLDPIVLKTTELATVTINGTPSITYKTDTVEYRASDYKVRENSTVDELLRHMEGFEVGSDGSVTHQGQAVTKARLNGKDYAGGNIAQAIQSLPADIVEKIQVVDDYGDQAARTGIKDGDPTKVLNITTIANKSIGNIGRATATEGTNSRYNDMLFYNRINANQVIVVNAGLNNSVIGVNGAGSGQGNVNNSNGGQAGNTTRENGTFSYRDQLSKTTQINGAYNYGNTYNFSINNSNGASFSTITDPLTKLQKSVTTIDTISGVTRSNNYSHNFSFDYEWQPDSQNYIRIRPNYSYSQSTGNTGSSSNYVGYQNENTSTHNTSSSTSPNYGIVGTYQYLWKKDRRQNLSVSFTNNTSKSTSYSTTNENITYRDTLGKPVKDSLVNRSTAITSTNYTDNVSVQYAQPLTKPSAAVQQRLEFTGQYSYRGYEYDKVQSNVNASGILSRVDSLSNLYNYSFTQSNAAIRYNRTGGKSTLTLGARVLSTTLAGDNISKGTTTNHNDFYVLPVFRYQYQWTRTEQITVNYDGNANEPTFAQIQPVPDYSNNPQNPIFGNPNLKPAFTHSISTRFNDYIANSKFNLSLNSTTSYVQDQIIQNNILISQPITVVNKITGKTSTTQNVITQTHYLNTSGGLSESFTHNLAKQLNDRAYNLELNGTIGYGYSPVYNNGIEFHQTTWHFNERFGPRINPNTTFEINPYISYDINRDFSSIISASPLAKTSSDIRTTILDLQGRIFLFKDRRFTFQYDLSKNYVSGIQGFNKNPFVTNAYVDYEFFKKKNGILRFSAFDIFNQNVFINHQVTALGYTNTQSNTLSRYFTLSFILNLQKFTGTPTRNGRQMMRRGDGSFIVN
jgi:hypothetical protein